MRLGSLSNPTNVHPLTSRLRDAIITYERNRPRSLQVEIGPSGVGQKCARRVAYTVMAESTDNAGPGINSDPWASIIGTAVHAWLANALLAENARLGRLEWLVEKRLLIRPGLEGNCDAFHVPYGRVVDHKVVNADALKRYIRDGPGMQYRYQAHLYGLGWENLNVEVSEVAIAFYSRSGYLNHLYVWSEPYKREIAMEALERLDRIIMLATDLRVDEFPENYALIPREPSRLCMYCPWFRPGRDRGKTCPGGMEIPKSREFPKAVPEFPKVATLTS